LYAPAAEDERKIGQFIGAVAAVAALGPITLLRSDQWHFVGPMSTALPILIVAVIFLFPRALPGMGRSARHVLFAAILLLLAGAYATPIISEARLMVAAFGHLPLSLAKYQAAPPTTIERRLGFPANPDVVVPAPWAARAENSTFHQLESIIQEI